MEIKAAITIGNNDYFMFGSPAMVQQLAPRQAIC
jgi:hypothetical protein